MNEALERGAGDQLTEKGPRRRQPTKAHKQSTRDGGLHSAPPLNHQDPRLVRTRGEKRILSGNVVYHTTRVDDPYRHSSAAAIAGRVLAQMRRLHEAGGGPLGDLDRAEAWFDVAVSQFVLIEAARPKWTFGPRAWAKRYVPELMAAKSANWISARIRDHRQQRRFYTSATIGSMLGVTREHFFAERLWHLWPAGISEADRKRLSLDIKAAWARADRAAKGATPRARSLSRVAPWVALGISRRTFERRHSAGRL